MTYKEIINRFREVVEDHWMIQDFGYGELSDIKTQSQLGPEEQGTDYPYMFLNPTSHTRTGPVMNYSFNMIMMDMARGEEGDVYDNYITIQSQCQQYIDDVLSQLYYGYSDKPEIQLTGITYTPFKEKYQDTLAGMTATITIQVPTPIDNCIAPFNPFLKVILPWGEDQLREPDPSGTVLGYLDPTYDPDGLFHRVVSGTYPYVGVYVEDGVWQMKVVGTASAVESKPIPPAPLLLTQKINIATGTTIGGPIYLEPTLVTGWPEGETTLDEFTWTAIYNATVPTLADDENFIMNWSLRSGTPEDESKMLLQTTESKFYKL